MIADRAVDGGAATGRLGAIKALFVPEDGAERFPPATRFAIVAGGSALFWVAVAAAVLAARH